MRKEGMPGAVSLLLVLDAVLVLLYLGDLACGQPFGKLTALVDLDGEGNLPTWFSSMQLLVAGLLFAGAADRERAGGRAAWSLWTLALIFAALSLDEVAEVHEWLGGRSDVLLPGGSRENTVFWKTGIWMFLLGIPFVAVMAGLARCLRAYGRQRPRMLRLFVTGLVLFGGSALLVELLSNAVTEPGGAMGIVQVCTEELGEFLGCTCFVWSGAELWTAMGMRW